MDNKWGKGLIAAAVVIAAAAGVALVVGVVRSKAA